MGVVARQGDLTNTHAAVVVNAGNTSLWLGSGVAGAIARAGGPGIKSELDRIKLLRTPRRTIQGPNHSGIPGSVRPYSFSADIGTVDVTHAGNMKAKLVFHAAVMDSQGPNKGKTDMDVIRMATVNCMLLMRQYGLNGITFPIFGTGVGGMDMRDSTKTMLQAISDYETEDLLIRLYAFTDSDYQLVAGLVNQHRGWG